MVNFCISEPLLVFVDGVVGILSWELVTKVGLGFYWGKRSRTSATTSCLVLFSKRVGLIGSLLIAITQGIFYWVIL